MSPWTCFNSKLFNPVKVSVDSIETIYANLFPIVKEVTDKTGETVEEEEEEVSN